MVFEGGTTNKPSQQTQPKKKILKKKVEFTEEIESRKRRKKHKHKKDLSSENT